MNSTTAPTRFRFHYLDDSGSPDTGYATFTWLALGPEHWDTARALWTAFRTDLETRYRIPAAARLHATDLLTGRRNASLDSDVDLRSVGRRIVREGLEVIAGMPGLSVGTVYRRGVHPGQTKHGLYRALLAYLDEQLRRAGTLGMLFIDGDGSDHRYAAAHGTLPPVAPNLIEAPVFRPAEDDQWVQMADFAAWSAYQSILRRPNRRRFWNWYPRTVGRLDPTGPIPL
jgi:uncharacterized protein DUF3800